MSVGVRSLLSAIKICQAFNFFLAFKSLYVHKPVKLSSKRFLKKEFVFTTLYNKKNIQKSIQTWYSNSQFSLAF